MSRRCLADFLFDLYVRTDAHRRAEDRFKFLCKLCKRDIFFSFLSKTAMGRLWSLLLQTEPQCFHSLYVNHVATMTNFQFIQF